MGWQDRDYARDDYGAAPRRIHGRFRANRYNMTTRIIIANAVVFLAAGLSPGLHDAIYGFGLMQATAVMHGQVWRLFTATYLHAGFMHIFINMLLLYFVGPALEQQWGTKQFFWVYTVAGIAGNLLLTLAGAVNYINPDIPGLGASGSVLATLGAAAVLFPHAEVYVYFLLPVRIRTAVSVYAIWFVYNVWQKGANYGGDLCHLAGLAVGVYWAYRGSLWWSRRRATGYRRPVSARKPPTFKERIRTRRQDQATVDRILDKVYQKGVHSLSPTERRTLTEATERLKQNEVR